MSNVVKIQENEARNNGEMRSGTMALSSTPQYVTIGAHYKCNARCVFCLGGNYPDFSLDVYKRFFEPKLGDVLRQAKHVGFCGWGELLMMPGIEEFLDHINATLAGSGKDFTTNGLALNPRLCDKLLEGYVPEGCNMDAYSVMVSLHASNAALHERLTGIRAFDRIVGNIKYLMDKRRATGAKVHVRLVFIATAMNIDDLPAFVELAERLGVDAISVNHVSIFEPEQFKFSTFFCQEKANEMFDRAQAAARNVSLSLPPRFGPHPVDPKNKCEDPWNFFYVETQGSVNPCCFAGNHIGYLDKEDFSSIWNGPGYTALREGLVTGNIHTWCRLCYKHDPNNVNDIRSHITFRPDQRRKLLDYLEREMGYKVPRD